jgi:gliding motility-associated-like protein
LGSIVYDPEMAWSEQTFDIIAPSTISAIALGSACTLSSDYGFGPGIEPCYPYFLFDDLELSLVDVTVDPEISLTTSGDPCQGDLLLQAIVTPVDPLGQTLQWYLDGIALIGEDSPTYAVDPGLAGLGGYQAVVFTNGNCALSQEEVVSSTPIQVTASSATICAGEQTTITASGAESYIWSNGTVGNTLSVGPSTTTTYSVIGTGTGCSDTATTTVQVDPLPIISLDTDVTLYEEMDSVQIVALVDTGAYEWSPSLGLSCTDCLAPYASPTFTTEYCITATLATCTTVACITVTVPPPLDPWDELGADLLYVPNSFTPDQDGINDTWGPITGNWETIRVDVFDRWGRAIHGTDDGSQFWDGQLRDGTAAPTGIYTYMIRVRFTNRTIKEVRGHVVLLR